MTALLTRKQAAETAGVQPETLRYYEREDLLQSIQRSPSGYRLYAEEDILRVRFIKRLQELGFQLKEIRDLLNALDRDQPTCGPVQKLTGKKLLDVRQKQKDLFHLEKALLEIQSLCESPQKDCPFLETLMEQLAEG